MDAIIIGGGIGGLTLALALHASGAARRIRIFEAAPDIRPLGVGINLGPHAVKELSALGLQDALAAVACQPQDYAFFTRHGQLVYREPWGLAAGHQWPHFSIHRADLHQVLLDAVRARLGTENFITGHRCVGIEQSGARVTARFAAPDGAALEPQRRRHPDRLRRRPFGRARAVLSGRRPVHLSRHQSLARRHPHGALPHRPQHRAHRRAAFDPDHLSDPRQYRRRRQPAGQLGGGDRARGGGAGRLEQAGAARGFPPGLPGLDVRLARRAGDDAQRRRDLLLPDGRPRSARRAGRSGT